MRIRRVFPFLILLLLGVLPARVFAVPQLGNLISPLQVASTVGNLAWEALSAFRVPFNPVGAVIGIGIGVAAYELCDAAQCYNYLPGDNVPAPSVPGWSNPNTPPPSVAGANGYTYNGTTYATASDYAQAFCAGQYYGSVAYTVGRVHPNDSKSYQCGCPDYCKSNPQNSAIWWPFTGTLPSPSTSCGWCYNADGAGHCLLDSSCDASAKPAQWPSDGKPTIRCGKNGCVAEPRDPDVGTYQGIRTGSDAHANPVRETIKGTADGGADYVRDSESTDASGAPSTNRDTVHTDANGTVTGTGTKNFPNTSIGNVDSGTGTGNVNIDTSGLDQEVTQQRVAAATEATRTNTDALKQDVAASRTAAEGSKTNLDSIKADAAASRIALESIDRKTQSNPVIDVRGLDLEVTQQRVAAATEASRTAMESIDTKLTKDTTAFLEVPAVDDFGVSWATFMTKLQSGPVGAMFAVSVNEPSGGCETYPVNLGAYGAFTLDQHCTIWMEVSPVIAGFMPYVWSILAVFILFSA